MIKGKKKEKKKKQMTRFCVFEEKTTEIGLWQKKIQSYAVCSISVFCIFTPLVHIHLNHR